MTDREIMQQALETLDRVMSHGSAVQEAKDILRERLAQPEQEPVAWLVQYSNKHEFVWGQKPQWIADAVGIEPLYTTPPRREWVGLTDDQVSAIADQHSVEGFELDIMAFARSIEAKLKEKNT